jgi:hypothetical protein
MDMIFDFILGAGEFVLLAGIGWLTWRLRQEQAARREAVAALHERQAIAEEKALRLALLDRRLAVVAPLETFRLAIGRGCRPDLEICRGAAQALGEARLLFPGSLAGELTEAAALLRDYARNLAWQHEAVGSGRHGERIELAEAEIAIEQRLRPKLDGICSRLAQNTRVED